MRQSPVLISVFVIHFCLGAFFAWPSASRQILHAPYSGWIFLAGVLMAVPVLAGAELIRSRIGKRLPVVLGGLFLGGGFSVGAIMGESLLSRIFFYGILGGAGIALAYVVSLYSALRWYPERKGFASGIASGGLLLGILFWDETAWGLLPFFEASPAGLSDIFMIFGVLISAAVALGSISAVPPDENQFVSGPLDTSGTVPCRAPAGRLPGKVYFCALWFIIFFSFAAVFLILDSLFAFGLDALSASGLETRIAAKVSLVSAFWFWIIAASGSVTWGAFSDRLNHRPLLFAMFIAQTAVFFGFQFISSGAKGLILASCLIGFNFGGFLALFPLLAADSYGERSFVSSYSLLFSALLAAAVFGLMVSSPLKGILGIGGDPSRWMLLFAISGIFCLVSAVITLFLKRLQ